MRIVDKREQCNYEMTKLELNKVVSRLDVLIDIYVSALTFQLWTPLNVILFNLVVSDFMVSILGNPWTFVSAIVRRWVFGRLCCKLYAFIMAQLGNLLSSMVFAYK